MLYYYFNVEIIMLNIGLLSFPEQIHTGLNFQWFNYLYIGSNQGQVSSSLIVEMELKQAL